MNISKCKVCGQAPPDGSPPNGSPMKHCTCKVTDAVYCSETCQTTDWKDHSEACTAARQSKTGGHATEITSSTTNEPSTNIVKAVDLTGGFNKPFHPVEVEITSDHAIFRGAGIPSPISKLIGHPILIYRHLRDNPLNYLDHPERGELDNQSVTYMMIDPKSGVAPPKWQCGIGRVTVARQDKTPLTKMDLEKIWMYCDHTLDCFNDGEGPPFSDYNQAAYEEWTKQYEEEKRKDIERYEQFLKSMDWATD